MVKCQVRNTTSSKLSIHFWSHSSSTLRTRSTAHDRQPIRAQLIIDTTTFVQSHTTSKYKHQSQHAPIKLNNSINWLVYFLKEPIISLDIEKIVDFWEPYSVDE